ncbi:hypothetical protein LKL35_36155 [Streptomyces sp. ET3-23]|uniref:hypothetical protein n=1 Tax=Streptomyces sp. ET3-23 TaxID=2885643 RepID=UPI001D10FA86|nr:hypothetical protein [Streptomyces sp. ET3-23]MCC2280768.1 hypothetical protein [Streptomyces sp. ET3-23]
MTITPTSQRTRLLIRQARATAQTPLERLDQQHWNETAVTFQHQLKACRVAGACTELLERLGYPQRAAAQLVPVLHHFEALVYRTDGDLEEHQRGGAGPKGSGREGIDAILAAYGLSHDTAIETELDTLVRYAQAETRIMQGRLPLTAELIRETCYSRSAHIRLLLRFALRLADLSVDEEFMSLARHVFARDEVVADCVGYEQDVRDDSFNTLRLHAHLHGPHKAADAQRALAAHILHELHTGLARASRPALVRFGNAFLPRPATIGARHHTPDSRMSLARRLAPLTALRHHTCRQAGRTARLTMVAVPDPRTDTRFQ